MRRASQPLDPDRLPVEVVDPVLDELYRRHAGWLRAGLTRRFGRDVLSSAEDLVQETYVRAAQAPWDTSIRSPRAFLMRIASRLALDQLRASRRRKPAATGAEPAEPGMDADQEATVLLKQVILSLPPNLRDVFLLSRLGGLTYQEIAARTGVSVKTIEARMSKALALCAAHLRR